MSIYMPSDLFFFITALALCEFTRIFLAA